MRAQLRTTRVSPSETACPSSHAISATVPSSSASTGISIFIDSRITSVSPSSTSSPILHSIFHTVPVMWASTSGNCVLLESCAGWNSGTIPGRDTGNRRRGERLQRGGSPGGDARGATRSVSRGAVDRGRRPLDGRDARGRRGGRRRGGAGPAARREGRGEHDGGRAVDRGLDAGPL